MNSKQKETNNRNVMVCCLTWCTCCTPCVPRHLTVMKRVPFQTSHWLIYYAFVSNMCNILPTVCHAQKKRKEQMMNLTIQGNISQKTHPTMLAAKHFQAHILYVHPGTQSALEYMYADILSPPWNSVST